MAEKQIFYFDADKKVFGVFQGFVEHTGDPGLVFVEYTPANSLKVVRTKNPIRKDDITPHHCTDRDLPGALEQVMFKNSQEKGGILDEIELKNDKRVKELERKNYDLEMEVESLKQRLQVAQSGAKKMVAEASEISDSKRSRRTPFDIPPYDY